MPVDIELTGFCSAPEVALSTTRIDLGTLVQGWTGETKRVLVFNQGTGELTVSDVQLELGSSSQVRLASLPPDSLLHRVEGYGRRMAKSGKSMDSPNLMVVI